MKGRASSPRTVLWDVGGVLLSNGWDRGQRAQAAAHFRLDLDRLNARHARMAAALETGRLGFDDYLQRLVFDRPQRFSLEAMREYIFRRSRPRPRTLALLERLHRRSGVQMATLNNESRELNEYRIERFGLGRYFEVFCSSCYLGARKPDPAIYERALGVLGRRGEECVFVDDREENLAAPRELGIRALRFRSAERLEEELRGLGVRG